MSEKLLVIDLDKCIRCFACEVACKQENDLPPGPRCCRVVTVGPRKVRGELHMDFVPTICFQCDDPTCSYFCATNAITRSKDGIVLINEEKCIGCKLCVLGCPYGTIHFNPKKGKVVKCDLCMNRIDYGLEPSCVQHCIGGALQFVTAEELARITRAKHKVRIGKVCYTSDKWAFSFNI